MRGLVLSSFYGSPAIAHGLEHSSEPDSQSPDAQCLPISEGLNQNS